MDKTKEIPKIKDNGKKQILTKEEKIKQARAKMSELVKEYHTLHGYVAGLMEGE